MDLPDHEDEDSAFSLLFSSPPAPKAAAPARQSLSVVMMAATSAPTLPISPLPSKPLDVRTTLYALSPPRGGLGGALQAHPDAGAQQRINQMRPHKDRSPPPGAPTALAAPAAYGPLPSLSSTLLEAKRKRTLIMVWCACAGLRARRSTAPPLTLPRCPMPCCCPPVCRCRIVIFCLCSGSGGGGPPEEAIHGQAAAARVPASGRVQRDQGGWRLPLAADSPPGRQDLSRRSFRVHPCIPFPSCGFQHYAALCVFNAHFSSDSMQPRQQPAGPRPAAAGTHCAHRRRECWRPCRWTTVQTRTRAVFASL